LNGYSSSIVVHACNPSTQEDLRLKDSLGFGVITEVVQFLPNKEAQNSKPQYCSNEKKKSGGERQPDL
jgi:hypothetical protein